jgi:membrane-bound metal-dependent hydrolase YbcI (DUF457 family)
VEPFTHAFTSLALARAGQRRLPRFGMAMLVASGLAPDLDYASYFGGAGAFMQFHRSALHSLVGAAVMACAVAGAFCVLDKKLPPGKTAQTQRFPPLTFAAALAVCAIGAAGHVLLDVASGVGVQLLWPFRARWFAWNLAADVDVWLLVLLVAGFLLPLLLSLVREEIGERRTAPKGSPAAVITLLLLIAFLGARAHLRSEAVDLLLSREYHGRIPLSAGAFPESSTPFDWRGVVVTDNTIETIEVPVGAGAQFDSDHSLTSYKPDESPALVAGERAAATAKFLNYARFPVATVMRREDGYRVEVRDLRFDRDDAAPANIFVRVDLDSNMQIQQEGFRFAASPNQ